MQCPVCNYENNKETGKCNHCGFLEIAPVFLSVEDAEDWKVNVLIPAQREYLTKISTAKEDVVSKVLEDGLLKHVIDSDIDEISVEGVYDSDTLNIKKGTNVESIAKVLIKIKDEKPRESARYRLVLEAINENMLHNLVALMNHRDSYQLWVFSKEKDTYIVDDRKRSHYSCVHTGWYEKGDIDPQFAGKDFDEVYLNIIEYVNKLG